MRRVDAPQGTQAVIRALRLLKAFGPRHPTLTLDQLSESQDLSRTTCHRLLMALESEGLVSRDPTKNTYQLGAEVIALGSQALMTSDVRALVRPVLERVAEQSGESTTLEVLIGDQMLIVDGSPGRHRVAASLEIGTRWPVHATSTGKCILAHLPEDHREHLLRTKMARHTGHTVTDSDRMRQELELIRRQGFAIADQELEEDYVAVAAAFRDPLGQVQGALSVGGPKSRFRHDRSLELGELLRREAQALSER